MTGLVSLGSIPFLPYIAGGLLAVTAVGGWYLHHAGYEEGKTEIDAKWSKAGAEQAKALAAVTAQRDQAVRDADTASALARQSLEALAARGRDTVKEYYHANPAANVACIPAARLRGIADADAAAMAAARASR